MTNPDSALFKEYDKDVIEFIARGIENDDERRFNDLALRGFELQYNTIGPYREYCRRINISPQSTGSWSEIPAVASFAFGKVLNAAFPPRKPEDIYFASGVADLRMKRGPFFPDRDIRALMASSGSLLEKAYLFPDADAMKMLFMAPNPVMAPGMVMASGLERIKQRFGTEESKFLISFRGIDLRNLISSLRQCEKTRQPLALLGATWGFDYFFDSCRREGIRFRLAEGSRIVDSGGYAGRYTKCTKEEFFGKCGEILGIGEDHCINALWLCENSTVYFDNILKNFLSGIKRERCKESPPWCRTVVVDPKDFRPLQKGETGLLRHYDITNRAMAIAVQTDKMGYETEDGFEVIGKWNRDMKAPDVERIPQHPGGRVVSSVMDTFLSWKFSKIGKFYSSL